MSSLKHNKKRNTGLISEFFARYIAKAIIEHRDEDLKKAQSIFRKNFHKGTDLYRELRLFEALYDTRVSTQEAAQSLVRQVKEACGLQNQHKLDLEKTALLHEINSTLADPTFFDKEVEDYKMYGTIQVLLNHWRGKVVSENLSEAAQLEDKILQHLTRKTTSSNNEDNSNVLSMTNEDVDALVVKIMADKMNAKFQDTLTEDQKKILKLYVFSKNNHSTTTTELESVLEGIRTRTLVLVEDAKRKAATDKLDEVTTSKLDQVKGLLLKEYCNVSKPTDELVTFYLSVSKLEKELRDE